MTGDNSIAEAPAQETIQAELRSQMLARFEKWLDQTLAGEPPPVGLPGNLLIDAAAITAGRQAVQQTGPQADLYSLFSALTALTGEIRLQGRAFKLLSDLLTPLSETPAMLAQLNETQAQSTAAIEAFAEQTAEEPSLPVDFKQVCDVMIDLFDRLQRGLKTCDEGIQSLHTRRKTGWLHQLLGTARTSDQSIASVQAIRDAGALTLARLQAASQEWGIERIGRIGQAFDPDRMTVVEVRVDPQAVPETVLLVNRSGYAVNGIVKATAQVTVSKSGG